MHRALAYGIARHGAAAVLGCDVPHCPWDVLDDAEAALARGDCVLGPADDGGYYLLGLTQARAELFEGIAWGGPDVLAATLARATALDIEFTLLPRLRDIDTAADLWLVGRCYPPLARYL